MHEQPPLNFSTASAQAHTPAMKSTPPPTAEEHAIYEGSQPVSQLQHPRIEEVEMTASPPRTPCHHPTNLFAEEREAVKTAAESGPESNAPPPARNTTKSDSPSTSSRVGSPNCQEHAKSPGPQPCQSIELIMPPPLTEDRTADMPLEEQPQLTGPAIATINLRKKAHEPRMITREDESRASSAAPSMDLK